MKKFRVIASQVVYSYLDIEAETAEQAEDLALDSYEEWKDLDFQNWQLESALTEEIK